MRVRELLILKLGLRGVVRNQACMLFCYLYLRSHPHLPEEEYLLAMPLKSAQPSEHEAVFLAPTIMPEPVSYQDKAGRGSSADELRMPRKRKSSGRAMWIDTKTKLRYAVLHTRRWPK
jgi:hypothetical protein